MITSNGIEFKADGSQQMQTYDATPQRSATTKMLLW